MVLPLQQTQGNCLNSTFRNCSEIKLAIGLCMRCRNLNQCVYLIAFNFFIIFPLYCEYTLFLLIAVFEYFLLIDNDVTPHSVAEVQAVVTQSPVRLVHTCKYVCIVILQLFLLLLCQSSIFVIENVIITTTS